MKSQIYPCSLLLLCFPSIVNLLRSRVKSVLCRSGFPSVACEYEILEFQNNPWRKFSGLILIFSQTFANCISVNQPHHLHIMRYKRMFSKGFTCKLCPLSLSQSCLFWFLSSTKMALRKALTFPIFMVMLMVASIPFVQSSRTREFNPLSLSQTNTH
jgi:hypothetical protein